MFITYLIKKWKRRIDEHPDADIIMLFLITGIIWFVIGEVSFGYQIRVGEGITWVDVGASIAFDITVGVLGSWITLAIIAYGSEPAMNLYNYFKREYREYKQMEEKKRETIQTETHED